MSKGEADFGTEADMVAAWLTHLESHKREREKWTIYPETADWDLLLVHRDGYQVGIEAKLSLNAKVLAQALSGTQQYWTDTGPDYRAVLVPQGKCQLHMSSLAAALGIKVLMIRQPERGVWYGIDLPDESNDWSSRWACWLPEKRCPLPEYVPDVTAGHACPVKLTEWKIKAIKLMILLERRGFVGRGDMKALQISPTRWTDSWQGFLSVDPGLGGYVRNERTPDLKAQHPENWAQIEADYEKWCPPGYRFGTAA